MKLEVKDIKFIDEFLKRNDVIFVDIRAEITDHIASAVEEKMETEKICFYDAFRFYMIENKKEIFKMNTKSWFDSLLEIKSFILFICKPKNILLPFIVTSLIWIFQTNSFIKNFQDSFSIYFLVFAFLLSVINILYFWIIKRKRFYFVEKTSKVLLFLYWINLISLNPSISKYFSNVWYFMLCFFLFVGYLQYLFFQTRIFFKLKLNRI